MLIVVSEIEDDHHLYLSAVEVARHELHSILCVDFNRRDRSDGDDADVVAVDADVLHDVVLRCQELQRSLARLALHTCARANT